MKVILCRGPTVPMNLFLSFQSYIPSLCKHACSTAHTAVWQPSWHPFTNDHQWLPSPLPSRHPSAIMFTNVPRTNKFWAQFSLGVNNTHPHLSVCLAASALPSCQSAKVTFQECHTVHVCSQLNTLPQQPQPKPFSSKINSQTRHVTHLW